MGWEDSAVADEMSPDLKGRFEEAELVAQTTIHAAAGKRNRAKMHLALRDLHLFGIFFSP